MLMGLVCLGLVAFLTLARPRVNAGNDASKPEPLEATFCGKWLLQSRTVNGKRQEDPPGVYLQVPPEGMLQTYSPVGSSDGPGPTLVQNVFYRLDPQFDPVAIDTAGRSDWSDVRRGICQISAGSLTLCFAAQNEPRPTLFSTGAEAGMGEVIFVYRRVGPGGR
jgi:uncharacterized protein (TIGR03067 family)